MAMCSWLSWLSENGIRQRSRAWEVYLWSVHKAKPRWSLHLSSLDTSRRRFYASFRLIIFDAITRNEQGKHHRSRSIPIYEARIIAKRSESEYKKNSVDGRPGWGRPMQIIHLRRVSLLIYSWMNEWMPATWLQPQRSSVVYKHYFYSDSV